MHCTYVLASLNGSEFDKGESARSGGSLIVFDLTLGDFPELAEVGLEVLVCRVVADSSHKHFPETQPHSYTSPNNPRALAERQATFWC